MIEPVEPVVDRRTPIPNQLAVRVAVLGGFALIMFAIIFFRLWFLQVLSGDQYVQQANTNPVRVLPIAAPRGRILDRNGTPLATDRLTNAVELVPSQLPTGSQRTALFRRLGPVLGMSVHDIYVIFHRQQKLTPYANVTLKTDAGRDALIALAEQKGRFPGVQQQQVYLRQYPLHDLAAQALGYVGQISPDELNWKRYRGVTRGTIVGQAGIEAAYDGYLRGHPGADKVQVDANNQPTGQVTHVDPIQGHDLKLTIDSGLEQAGWNALKAGIGLAQGNGNPADAGAFVAMDPRNGEVLATGSLPSFDPNVFAGTVTDAQAKQIFGSQSGGPPGAIFNRAVTGGYPTGSTFKPITAMGALMSGVLNPDEGLGAGQCITVTGGQQFCNSGKVDYGALPLVDALRVSSDTYFFTVGELANYVNGRQGAIIQSMARQLGFGHPTGIDLPGEASGNVPDPAWRARQGRLEQQCEARTHKLSCGISDKRPWSVGDNMNLAVGQGDLLANPLQMAVAYSTLENGGTVVRPHLGLEVDDSTGAEIQRIDPAPRHHLSLNQNDLALVREGLHEAASAPGGTSADVWNGWDQTAHPIFGKTGTAQHSNAADQSWYVCWSPDPARPIVIAMTIEQGGFGAQAAAPAARLMMSQWFHVKAKLVAGQSRTL